MTKELLKEFEAAMHDIYKRAKQEADYNPTAFLNMLYDKGALDTANTLVNTKRPSSGYTALWELGRLDLTVEALIHDNPKYHALFDAQTLANAEKRLRAYGYKGV